jgi:hypothetical protein
VLIDKDQNWWKYLLVKEIFSEEEAKAILSIPIGGTNRPDTQIWKGTASGMFTIQSAYHLAKELSMQDQAECSLRREESPLWKGIWSSQLPNAVKIFMWLACKNILPTRSR